MENRRIEIVFIGNEDVFREINSALTERKGHSVSFSRQDTSLLNGDLPDHQYVLLDMDKDMLVQLLIQLGNERSCEATSTRTYHPISGCGISFGSEGQLLFNCQGRQPIRDSCSHRCTSSAHIVDEQESASIFEYHKEMESVR